MAIVGLGALAAALCQLRSMPAEPGAAVARLGRGTGIRVDERSFSWVRPDDVMNGDPFAWHGAVFLARPPGEHLNEMYSAELTVSADGRPAEMRRLTDLSRTADGDECELAVSGDGLVAFASRVDATINSVSVVDFRGEPRALTSDWPWGLRLANGITNLQRTGQTAGVAWKTFVFREPPKAVSLAFEGEALSVRASGLEPFAIERDGVATSQDVIVQESLKGKPALLAWAVDTAREVPWIAYYDRSYALHGEWWHDRLGRPHSLGCINLAPADARWLFEWLEPALPVGWYAVVADAHDHAGTLIVIRR